MPKQWPFENWITKDLPLKSAGKPEGRAFSDGFEHWKSQGDPLPDDDPLGEAVAMVVLGVRIGLSPFPPWGR